MLPCLHVFHRVCVDSWFQANGLVILIINNKIDLPHLLPGLPGARGFYLRQTIGNASINKCYKLSFLLGASEEGSSSLFCQEHRHLLGWCDLQSSRSVLEWSICICGEKWAAREVGCVCEKCQPREMERREYLWREVRAPQNNQARWCSNIAVEGIKKVRHVRYQIIN